MTDIRPTMALTNLSASVKEIAIVLDSFSEAIALLNRAAAGITISTEAHSFILEMERRKLVAPDFYLPQRRLCAILDSLVAPGRITAIGWERMLNFRQTLHQIITEYPEKTAQALAKPGLRRWFLGQMLLRNTRANTEVAAVTDLIETVFKEASR